MQQHRWWTRLVTARSRAGVAPRSAVRWPVCLALAVSLIVALMGRPGALAGTGKQATQDDSVYCQQTRDGRVIPKPYGQTYGQIPCRRPPRTPGPDPWGLPPAMGGELTQPQDPTIVYRKVCDRGLIFVNNPEQLFPTDLGDRSLGNVVIFRAHVQASVQKQWRNYFEHTNRTGFPIRYGVEVSNPTGAPVHLQIYGTGFATGDSGGEPFRQLFEFERMHPVLAPQVLRPGERLWLLKPPQAIPQRAFLSGVVDFDVLDGEVDVDNLAYRSESDLNPHGGRQDMGFQKRVESDGTKTQRQYKGLNPCTEVVAEGVDFTIRDTDRPGPLAVWYTHSNRDPKAIGTDMFGFEIPREGIVIEPQKPAFGERELPNLGNWGVVYTVRGQVTNAGTQARCMVVAVQVTSTAQTAKVAYRDRTATWRQARLMPQQQIDYYRFTVPGGQTQPYDATFVLGGPSSSDLRQSISVAPDLTSCSPLGPSALGTTGK